MSADGTNTMPPKLRVPALALKTLANGSAGVAKKRPTLPTSKSFQEKRMMSNIKSVDANGRVKADVKVKTDWLVVFPDREGVLEKRMEVRPDHFKGLTRGMESGFWKVGGATLEEPYKEGEPMKINGSAMIARAASKEELIEELKKDVYTAAGIWDWDKVQIWPFKAAFYKGE